MFSKFWDKLAEGLAGRWTAQTLGPALAFWGGGILALVWRSGQGWRELTDRLETLDHTAAYVALAVGGLLVLTVSSTAITWLRLPALRLLEGYWPGPFRKLRFRLARVVERRLQKKTRPLATTGRHRSASAERRTAIRICPSGC